MEEIEINENNDYEVDTTWIDDFEKQDSLYKDFYKEKVQDIYFQETFMLLELLQ